MSDSRTSPDRRESPRGLLAYWQVPSFDHPLEQREANLLFSVLRAQAIGLVALAVLAAILLVAIDLASAGPTIVTLVVSLVPILVAMAVAHHGRLHWGSYFAIATAVVSTVGVTVLTGGLRSGVVLALVFGPLVASVLRGRKALLCVGALVLGLVGGVAFLEELGVAPIEGPMKLEGSIVPALITTAVTLLLFMALLYIYSREVERANAAEAEAGDRAAELVRESPDGIAVVGEDGTLISVNAALERMSGYSAEELVGQHLLAVPGVPSPKTRAQLEKGLGQMGADSALVRLSVTRKDGTPYFVETNPRALTLPDGRKAMQVVIRDVTARVEAEEKQRKLELDLQDARRMEGLGRLAGGLAHDLRNMLTPILVNAGELRSAAKLERPVKAMVEEIEASGTRASELVDQILTFARRQRLDVAVVDVNRELRSLEPMLRRLIPTNVEVSFELDDRLLPVRADKSQLGQVVVNLVANARDAMPDGGTLTLETRRVRVPEGSTEHHLNVAAGTYSCITVSDTGEGMSEQVRQHIFDPFFTTKGMEEGVGLGLATVHGIVKQSGGTIYVHSEPGQGASFRIYLPAVTETVRPAPSPEPARADSAPAEGIRLLLVDDEMMVRRVLVRALERAEIEVIQAGDAQEAMQKAEAFEGTIDALVTDVVMPGRSGPELAKELLKSRPEMKVLFLSGYTDLGMTRSASLGEDAQLLTKPFSPAELLKKIHAIVNES